MFNQCESLKDLKFQNLYINNYAIKDYMFEGCKKLEEDKEWKNYIKKIISYCICF